MTDQTTSPKPKNARQPSGEGLSSSVLLAVEYQPETWAMLKDTIYAARTALEAGLENTQELLIEHDASLGRTTRKNRFTAERLESEIRAMKSALEKLRKPDGSFPANSQDHPPEGSA